MRAIYTLTALLMLAGWVTLWLPGSLGFNLLPAATAPEAGVGPAQERQPTGNPMPIGLLAFGLAVRRRTKHDEAAGSADAGAGTQHREILEQLPDAILAIRDDRIAFATKSAAEMLGSLSGNELIGMPAAGFFEPAQPATGTRAYPPAEDASSPPGGAQQILVKLNGQRIPVMVSTTQATYAGMPELLMVIREDGSPLSGGESPGTGEFLSDAIFEHSPLGISVRTALGKLITCNKAWQRIWGHSGEDIDRDLAGTGERLGAADWDSCLGEWQDKVRLICERGGSLHIPELPVKGARPGAAQWVSLHFFAIANAERTVDHVVVLADDITNRKCADQERDRLIGELTEALVQYKTLHGLLPICSHCKKIRDDQGSWNQLENYICEHSEAQFTHGICPECAAKLYNRLRTRTEDE